MKLTIPLFRKSDSIHVFLLVHLIIGLYLIPWAGDFGVAAQLTRTMSKRNTVWKETSLLTERSSSFFPERKRKKKRKKERKGRKTNTIIRILEFLIVYCLFGIFFLNVYLYSVYWYTSLDGSWSYSRKSIWWEGTIYFVVLYKSMS